MFRNIYTGMFVEEEQMSHKHKWKLILTSQNPAYWCTKCGLLKIYTDYWAIGYGVKYYRHKIIRKGEE